MLIPPSTTQGVDDAGLEFLELLKGVWFVRKEIEPGFGVSFDMDDSFMNPIINPVIGNIKGFPDFWHCKIASNPAWMGLTTFLHDTVFQPNGFNGTRQ